MNDHDLVALTNELEKLGFQFATLNEGSHCEIQVLDCGRLRLVQDDNVLCLNCFTSAGSGILQWNATFCEVPNAVVIAAIKASLASLTD